MNITLADDLGLPPGWIATRFPNTIELELRSESGFQILQRTGIPVPYEPMTQAQWKEAAAKAIQSLQP